MDEARMQESQNAGEGPDDSTPTQQPLPAPTDTSSSIEAAKSPKTYPAPLNTTPNRPIRSISSQVSADQTDLSPAGDPFSPWSDRSDAQLGGQTPAASDVSGDRVFPIRSIVSFDPSSSRVPHDGYFPSGSEGKGENRGISVRRPGTSRTETPSEGRRASIGTVQADIPATRPGRSHTSAGPMSRLQLDAARQRSAPLPLNIDHSDPDSEEHGGANPRTSTSEQDTRSVQSLSESLREMPHITTRFTHAEIEEGHAIITGRDGTLQRCEDEPIHTPGAVQGFGVLIALREEQDGCFIVRYVSENSERLFGLTPAQLFRLENFLDILTEEQQDNILDHIDFIRDEDADPAIDGPEVFSLSIRPFKRRSTKLWCAVHINAAHPDLVICEFEMDDDQDYPLRPLGETSPDIPHDTLQSDPTLEEIEESTEIISKPLRILRSARKRRGEQGAMQVFDIMSQVQEQLASAPNLDAFLKILVGIMKELTGFHRVMIYQFDSSFNGKVVTELVDTSKTRDLYKGLNFPASDIPRQARDLYKLNKVRLLYDRDLETARIVCRTKEDLDVPLDMSHSYLRAMSPIHLKYLANMAVRSSMSISINAFDELWGLIACHSYGGQGMRVSFPIRKMCRLVGDTASRNIERLSYASRLQARKLINTEPTDKNPTGYIIASSDDLLKLFDADFGVLSIQGETKIMGVIDQSQEALVMLEYLRMRQMTSIVASQDITQDFPDLRYPPGFQVVAGLLYVPLSVGGKDFIVFFRRGQIKEVKWAGNPYEKVIRQGTAGYLEPRTSFKSWHETVIGKCREWVEEQIETAAVLCLVYGKFIEVWRQKEAALQSSKLTRLLLANSAHEVRTPLNAIINYLEIALEGTLDEETRENLARSHSASKSLIYVINDLLDLTKTEEGQSLIKSEKFELPQCIHDATEPFRIEARRKGIDYQVTEHLGLPRYVHGDERRIRQALSNVVANAVAHTASGYVKIEAFVTEVQDTRAIVEFVVEDTGGGMSAGQQDTLFRDLEQVSTEQEMEYPENMAENARDMRALGLGLAVVARTVRNMDGQLRLKSEEGHGSRFVMQLPFLLTTDESSSRAGESEDNGGPPSVGSNNVSSAPVSMTVKPEGEILLVDRANPSNVPVGREDILGGQQSLHGRASIKSFESHSSHDSDADRLIDALKTPLSLQGENPEFPFTPRSILKDRSKDSNVATGFRSAGSPEARVSFSHQGTSSPAKARHGPGYADVRDTKTPIKAIRVPEEYTDLPSQPQASDNSRVLFELPREIPDKEHQAESVASSDTHGTQGTDAGALQVLVAEDDPINMKILRKRLERSGHGVYHTANGEDCARVYRERSPSFDVVLMDMQMPIMDGLTSTKTIRALERSSEHAGLSPLAAGNARIPIFAVSASLVERDKDTYVHAGFDGWILKPIDFKRLNILLLGISDNEIRNTCLYKPKEWERGGWFSARDMTDSNDEITPIAEVENQDMGHVEGSQPDEEDPKGSDGKGLHDEG